MRRAESSENLTEQDLVHVYECFCDLSRLRILNLLMASPLCVCHLEQIIGPPQAKISRHLAYLKSHRMVTTQRYQNWSIYRIEARHSDLMQMQLKCLQDCTNELKVFKSDLALLKGMKADVGWIAKFVDGKPFKVPAKGGCS
ncbi:ArsR family transcriptional regulator [Roseimicrobium gellanilyticum]|uniref:ArsR family transcriptional regulator n=1 Tax=Roseimicrobium gellanilyticum TaxID=748857 RepID=A0A366H8R5_9BACT|nr:metalloregulator ArsR/SmtB family transcription factor [Roseimicrobium gellanilyticum]RBP38629.1 ArsR family transcriptional regulator [Roseimicrobium gellanilyticum]